MIRATSLLALALLAACETRPPGADSAVALDTINPVVVNAAADSARHADSIRVADSLARARGTTKSVSRPATASPTLPTGSKTGDSARGHPNIGRDSVIRRPRQMPVDTIPRP